MAKSVRRRSSGSVLGVNSSSGTTAGPIAPAVTKNNNNNISMNTIGNSLQIQELQNIMDSQNEKFNEIKLGYSIQNSQLARANSLLSMKLNEIESKLTELIRENVSLRSDLNFYKHTKVNEEPRNTVLQDLDALQLGVVQRFDEILCIFKRFRENSVSNQPITPRKRLKSSRRESIVIEQSNITEVEAKQLHEQKPIQEEEIVFDQESMHKEEQEQEQEQEKEQEQEEDTNQNQNQNQEQEQEQDQDQEQQPEAEAEAEVEVEQESMALIDCSIPEEDHQQLLNSQPQKLNVFNDNSPLPSQKVKHSMKQRKNRNLIVDEIMPNSLITTNPRSKRTRGKTVDYTLPSLRAKMRRPTEKFVDATTVTNIHDLQVSTKSKRKLSQQIDTSPIIKPNIATTTTETTTATTSPPPLPPPQMASTAPLVLKDVTNIHNTSRIKAKTKKLFKKPIINNINDELLHTSNENSNSLSNENSFRLQEEDLSVFDFMGNSNIKRAPKTYRNYNKRL
ncbi:hypothetical protein Kpol_1018p79 [Vanderwaltozyma polyspora DSM 70294]|uniref:Shugoshin N-terminal coiled-coil domain-containing protein n=1 Tax=Vanderwaltozyma polyspora (strain ATCC 22028 / DSM 70294 / BCRC 21397 / CBS 2163 / NBRC 10782 / NRRL Y-8283 / UCD 57-17) TaxID=436907 RepID=A7TDS7_VANPO|nr:uncharacterized protein Kpol_1018p79 [Vanderwaltozyma polyspora DSM 70294]EDO19547.1 hypothetical protein Kpol_1018p79 [Vanderwaltozyma polyspora DSM 70294]